MKKGWIVAGLLAIGTILEYIFAVEIHDNVFRFSGLAGTALVKAVLITIYFMHIYRAWGPMEEHHS